MSKYRRHDFDDDDFYGSSTGNSLGDYFGSYPDEKLSASMERHFIHDKTSPNHQMCEFFEKDSPLFSEQSLEDEEKLLKECVEFLKSNGGDLEKQSYLEDIARRNNFDCDKSLADFQGFLFGESSPKKQVNEDEMFPMDDDEQRGNQRNQRKKPKGPKLKVEILQVKKPILNILENNQNGKKKKKKKKKRKMLSTDFLSNNNTSFERVPTPMPSAARKIKPNIFLIERPQKKHSNKKVIKKSKSGSVERNLFEKKGPWKDKKKMGKTEESKKEVEKKFKKKKVEVDTEKTRLNIVIIGHVDAGKSTMMGKLLFDSGNVSQQLLHKYAKQSQEIGKSSFYLAWVLDEQEDERSHGVTIDVGVKHFHTPNRIITILDAPGHADFVPNMIMGAAQADVAVLVVDSITGAFESGFSRGGQTREHLIVARSLGIKQMVVAVNKMDVCEYSNERFEEIKKGVSTFIRTLGFRDSQVCYLPVSGLTGDNLVKPAVEKMPWYSGNTLIQHMDGMKKMKRKTNAPLRMCISDAFKNDHFGLCVAGTLDSGTVTRKEKVFVMPVRENAIVKKILRNGIPCETAYAGDNVEIALGGIEFSSLRVGQIVCQPGFPIRFCSRFLATIVTFELFVPIIKGSQVIVHLQNNKTSAVISKLVNTLDKKRKIAQKRPRFLKRNTTANCEITLETHLGMDLFEKNRIYGRIIIRRSGKTIASGIITKMFDD